MYSYLHAILEIKVYPPSLHPALEDGTDTGFRNVGQLQFDAGEIPKRTYTTVYPPLLEIEKCLQDFDGKSSEERSFGRYKDGLEHKMKKDMSSWTGLAWPNMGKSVALF
jgi:hypothetical protein